MPETLIQTSLSSIRDNRKHGSVGAFLTEQIEAGANLSFVSAYFTIYAYHHLKNKLDGIEHLRFLYGDPRFLKNLDPEKTDKKAFLIEDDQLVIPLKKRLQQKQIARQCEDWIRREVDIKSMVKPNFLHGKLYVVQNKKGNKEALVGSSNFTTNGLGLGSLPNIELNLVVQDKRDINDLQNWFDELWNAGPDLVEDVKDEVLKYLQMLYLDHDPEFIYFKTLFHLFEKFLSEQDEGTLLRENIGFYDTQIWNLLYDFQKDAVRGAVNKILKHNGCILADSVGLGKTFEALAVIKYFELLQYRVLVLCPKKLRENWTVYRGSVAEGFNPIKKDNLRYKVFSHTDLSRTRGEVDGEDLAMFDWSAFDLVVIDESHNFRANPKKRETEDGKVKINRVEALLQKILRNGSTKVLLLSATPVNNTLRDLRNQFHLITAGSDSALGRTTGIENISETMKKAQAQFTTWSDPKNKERKVNTLLERLGSDFFTLLDELTIARSRNHIKKYYDVSKIGKFPDRLPVQSVAPEIDLQKGRFPTYDKLNREIEAYKLSLFNPSAYVVQEWQTFYKEKAGTTVLNFSQEKREYFLIGMMKVNFLKRLESSIHSFKITLGRTIDRLEKLIELIEEFKASGQAEKVEIENEVLDLPEDEMDDEMAEAKEAWEVGKKLKFNLAHLNVDDWLKDLREDRNQLSYLLTVAQKVEPKDDAKLKLLKALIETKVKNPINDGNRKVIVFTAFSDTAKYLYDNLEKWALNGLGIDLALVTGGVGGNRTTFKPKGFKEQTEFNRILTNFSPISKNRVKNPEMPQEGEIDILIATDCISEGQNLQDCDYLINYDIHWNPVRIIQRFGRVDRLGSKNGCIQLVNFWATPDLDQYIRLKDRVEARMALVDVTATGEENLLNTEQLEDLITEDLKFRDKQLKRLQHEVLDLEDLNENLTLTEFSLEDFRQELLNYLKVNEKRLQEAPLGIYALAPSPVGEFGGLLKRAEFTSEQRDIIRPGVVFCFRQKGDTEGTENVNPLQPYFLVYVREDGEVRFNYIHAKQILDLYRLLCAGNDKPFERLCDWFNSATKEGDDMGQYNQLLKKSVEAIARTFRRRANQSLVSGRGGLLLPLEKQAAEPNDFELITWLIIR